MAMPSAPSSLQQAFVRSAEDHWALVLAEGIVLVILGFLAIALAPVASVTFTLVLGWLFLFSGLVGLISTFWVRPATGFWWSVASGILGIVAGLILIARPLTGTISLTIVLIAFFVIEGVVSIFYALDHRRALSGRWGLMLASGIIDLILAGIVYAALPGAAFWVIGLIVGINMIVGGIALIGMAFHAHQNAKARPA